MTLQDQGSFGDYVIRMAVPALIAHIVDRYHEAHRQELPILIRMAGEVETRHADHPEMPRGLKNLLEEMSGSLAVHMRKEELLLFPAMRKSAHGDLADPLAQMRHEHDEHAAFLDRLSAIAGDFTPPNDADGDWRRLYSGLAKLTEDLRTHITLENDVLFPRFDPCQAQ